MLTKCVSRHVISAKVKIAVDLCVTVEPRKLPLELALQVNSVELHIVPLESLQYLSRYLLLLSHVEHQLEISIKLLQP